ncbi:MAG: hypothetical protein DWQ02_22435, partial [Bacteroidetes bacterium]
MNNNDKNLNKIIGRGWSFPPSFSHASKEVEMTFGPEDIDRSLEIIVTTRLGERIMRPDFGCALDHFAFEPMNTTALGTIKYIIETALLYYEPRIEVNEVKVELLDLSILNISIIYTIRATNSRFNFVFPL